MCFTIPKLCSSRRSPSADYWDLPAPVARHWGGAAGARAVRTARSSAKACGARAANRDCSMTNHYVRT